MGAARKTRQEPAAHALPGVDYSMRPAPTLLILMLCLVTAAVARGQSSDLDRYRKELESRDKNNDGYLTEDETGGRTWSWLQRRAERYGQDRNADRYRIKKHVQARQKWEERQGRERQGESTPGSDPQARGFEPDATDPDAADPEAAGFSPAADRSDDRRRDESRDRREDRGSSERERAARYARGLLDRYDKNKNRVLERDEWRRISGSPEKSDANGDGVITLDELTARLEHNYRKRDGGDSSDRRSKRERSKRSRPEKKEGEQDERRSYRFTPPHERLPDGLPSWFRDRDQNGDGQVAMHEYSRSWSDSRAREFARYDGNGDGVITPAEAKDDR